MKLFKNKKNIIIAAVIIAVIVIISILLLVVHKKGSNPNVSAQPIIQIQQSVPSLSASSIGLSLSAGSGNHSVNMDVAKTQGIASLDYQLSYYSTPHILRGVIGHINVNTPGQAVNQNIVLGTCSDVCHYDQGVSSVSLILKITKINGKVYQSKDSLNL